jgi:hypothetical protein
MSAVYRHSLSGMDGSRSDTRAGFRYRWHQAGVVFGEDRFATPRPLRDAHADSDCG